MSDEAKEEKGSKGGLSVGVGDLLGGIGQGLGCFFICLGLVAIIWALRGFPGLVR